MDETVGCSIENVIYVMGTLGHALSSVGQYRTEFDDASDMFLYRADALEESYGDVNSRVITRT